MCRGGLEEAGGVAYLNERHATVLLRHLKARDADDFALRLADAFKCTEIAARHGLAGESAPMPAAAPGVALPVFVQTLQPVQDGIVPVRLAVVGSATVLTVDARELHGFLGVGKDFSTWIKDRIGQYGFCEGVDYTVGSGLSAPISGSPKARVQETKEYAISLDMAKELAMVERTERGKQARQYFIECERKLHAQPAPAPHPALPNFTDPAAAAIAWADQFRARQAAITKVAALEAENTAQAAKIEEDAPKIAVYERLCATEGSVSLTEAAVAAAAQPVQQPIEFPVATPPALPSSIAVISGEIGGAAVMTVNARELHGFLGVGKDFSNWVKDRIHQCCFEEGRDYVTTLSASFGAKGQGRPAKDYAISLDMAKELAMFRESAYSIRTPRFPAPPFWGAAA